MFFTSESENMAESSMLRLGWCERRPRPAKDALFRRVVFLCCDCADLLVVVVVVDLLEKVLMSSRIQSNLCSYSAGSCCRKAAVTCHTIKILRMALACVSASVGNTAFITASKPETPHTSMHLFFLNYVRFLETLADFFDSLQENSDREPLCITDGER